MSNLTRSNKYAAIPEVGNDVNSIANAVRALKQTVDVMSRQSGAESEWALTVGELDTYINNKVTNNTDFSKLLNDPTLDAILDRAAAKADRLAQQVRDEARIAMAALQTALDNLLTGVTDENAVIKAEISKLSTAVGDNVSAITTEKIARTTETQSLAGRIDTVSAQSQGGLATVTNEILALSGPGGSIATQIAAVTTASTPVKTYVQSTTPRALATNDYWVDINGIIPIVKQWSGTAWVTRTATIAAIAPTSPATNDLWFDTTTSLLKRWSGSAWVTQTAFVQSRTPSTISNTDLWLDTSQANLLKKWDGTAWVAVDNVSNLGVLLSTVTTESISKTDADRTTATRFDNLVSIAPDGNTASINGYSLTTATSTEALGNKVTNLAVQTTGGSAGGYYRLTASSTPGDGAAAEFAVEVRAAQGTAAYTTSAMRIQAFGDGTSRVKFNADKFIISNAADTFVPFAVTSGQLAINAALAAAKFQGGIAANVMFNASFDAGTEGWYVGYNNTGRTINFGRDISSTWTLDGGHTLYASYSTSTTAGLVFDMINYNGVNNERYPVVATKRYEASAYIGVHRAANSYVVVAWYNSSGVYISEVAGNAITTANAGGRQLSGYGRSVVIATPPAGAVTATFSVRTITTTETNPYCFMTRPYFGEAGSGQTEAANWVAGKEPQFGSNFRINSSNISTYISGAAIGTAYIGNLAVEEGNIADLAVSNGKIANLAVTTGKIANLAVETLKIAGNAVMVPVSVIVVDYSTTTVTLPFTISGLNAGESVPVHVHCGVVSSGVDANFTIYIDGVNYATDIAFGYIRSYVGANTFVGNGSHTVVFQVNNDIGSGLRRFSLLVQVAKR